MNTEVGLIKVETVTVVAVVAFSFYFLVSLQLQSRFGVLICRLQLLCQSKGLHRMFYRFLEPFLSGRVQAARVHEKSEKEYQTDFMLRFLQWSNRLFYLFFNAALSC